jgi:putative ABC transport system permease protein
VLLVGAGLLIKSFWSMKAVDPGFRSDKLLTMRLELPEAGYREISKQRQFRQRLLASLNSLPGVQGAMVSELPMSGESLAHTFVIDGRPPLASGREPEVQTRTVAGDYFHVLSVPFVTGRDFTPHDRDGSPSVVIVNERFVHQYFPNLDPVGARIRWARAMPPEWMTVIGVVGDVKHFGLDEPEEPAVYDLYAQTSEQYKRWMYLLVRSERDPADMGQAVKEQVWAINNALPVTKVRTMHEVMSVDVDAHKFNVTMLSVFAAVALVLAAIGIYGVMAYSVTQRTHEIGIRLALGAQRRDIFRMVLEDGGRLVALGTALGLVGALALTRLMTSLLFGVSARDPLTFIVVAGVLSGVALVASYVPARRALNVDPIVALRDH